MSPAMESLPRVRALGSAGSVLGFARTGGGRAGWDRFLTLDGKPAYHVGNVCDTCEFFFQRLDGATHSISAEELGAALAVGTLRTDDAWLADVGALLPAGDYIPFYARTRLTLVQPGSAGDYFMEEQIATWGVEPFWQLPHDPRTEYYRGRVVPIAPASVGNRSIFEFVAPMFPHGWLDADRVAHYRSSAKSSEPPIALALSILDVKGPATWDEQPAVAEHWCLTHYLLDGHHKVYAAFTAAAEITLLSFLAVAESIATQQDALDVASRMALPS